MKQILLLTMAAIAVVSTQAKNITTTNSNGYPITQVPFTAVKVNAQTFWGQRIKAAREVTIPLAFEKCETTHRYDNFKMAAYTLQHPGHKGLQTPKWDVSKLMGFPFDDTDVYKTIEGASYILQTYPDNTSHSIFRFLMPTNPQFNVVDRTINGQHQVSFGVKAIEVDGQSVDTDADGRVKVSDTRLTLIPYYAWNHRGANEMEVWLPQSIEALGNYR